MSEPADFVVLHMDGTASWGVGDVDSIMDALGVDTVRLDISGAGRVQVWHTDSTPVANPLSERVLTRLGYRAPTGWNGPIALTTRAFGRLDIAAPLAEDVSEAVEELATEVEATAVAAGAHTTQMVDTALPPDRDTALAEDTVVAAPLDPTSHVPDMGADL
ncbi:hypothetical protein [Nocardia nova]|jgi:hypothetical protein|uniref:hypothetical protein n=1 Tax=Nocardia nova TaxID=37330 RepID=UPI0007A3E530|nr:hypothetical protein [Nocardia nova]